MTLRPDATTAISPATLLASAAAEDGRDPQVTADATTRGSALQENAVMTTVATEDHQTAEEVMSAETAKIVVTTEEPKEGPAAATTAPAETAETTAQLAGTDATTELSAAEAPSKKEAVTRRRDPVPLTAGATTAIQVINKNKNRPPPSQSDAI